MRQPQQARSQQGSVDARVASLASRQYGVFGRDQLGVLGVTKSMTEHRLQVGRWETVAPLVYRVAGAAASWPQELMIACLAWGARAAVSHRAAAALRGLAGIEPGVVEITAPRDRRRVRGPGIVHASDLPPSDLTRMRAIPVTTIERTLLDLVGVLTLEALEIALDDALRRRLVSLAPLRRYIERAGRWPGVRVMRALIDARDPRRAAPQSAFETRLLRTIRDAGLPEPVAQHRVDLGQGRIAYIDFAYPERRLAIEADGFAFHSGRVDWERDRARRNALTLLGWRVIHVTWAELRRHPERVVGEIRTALGSAR